MLNVSLLGQVIMSISGISPAIYAVLQFCLYHQLQFDSADMVFLYICKSTIMFQ